MHIWDWTWASAFTATSDYARREPQTYILVEYEKDVKLLNPYTVGPDLGVREQHDDDS